MKDFDVLTDKEIDFVFNMERVLDFIYGPVSVQVENEFYRLTDKCGAVEEFVEGLSNYLYKKQISRQEYEDYLEKSKKEFIEMITPKRAPTQEVRPNKNRL